MITGDALPHIYQGSSDNSSIATGRNRHERCGHLSVRPRRARSGLGVPSKHHSTAQVQAARPMRRVELAFQDFMTPTLDGAVAQCARVARGSLCWCRWSWRRADI